MPYPHDSFFREVSHTLHVWKQEEIDWYPAKFKLGQTVTISYCRSNVIDKDIIVASGNDLLKLSSSYLSRFYNHENYLTYSIKNNSFCLRKVSENSVEDMQLYCSNVNRGKKLLQPQINRLIRNLKSPVTELNRINFLKFQEDIINA